MDAAQTPSPETEYFQFERQWQQAVAFLISQRQGIAVGALYHPKIGKIDLVWGEYKEDRSSSGYGLVKIVEKHPEVLATMQSILLRMNATFLNEKHGWRLQGYGFKANIRTSYNGRPRVWLMTLYEKEK